MRFTSTFFFAAVATGAALTSRSLSGEATFYGGNLAGGTCSFSTYTLPAGVYGTALSDSNWDDAGNCGACIAVTGPSGNTITAMVYTPRFVLTTPTNVTIDCRPMPRLRREPPRSLPRRLRCAR